MDIPSGALPALNQTERALREAAVQLEANFLAEMLAAAGVGETEHAFTGGAGESQFASFLRQEHAMEMARNGGIGLAEAIFESLKGKLDDPNAK